jgi:hypothetical protein
MKYLMITILIAFAVQTAKAQDPEVEVTEPQVEEEMEYGGILDRHQEDLEANEEEYGFLTIPIFQLGRKVDENRGIIEQNSGIIGKMEANFTAMENNVERMENSIALVSNNSSVGNQFFSGDVGLFTVCGIFLFSLAVLAFWQRKQIMEIRRELKDEAEPEPEVEEEEEEQQPKDPIYGIHPSKE